MSIEIDQEDFGTLCVCALRYCHGRETYMPGLVQSIVKQYLSVLSDKDVGVMLDDCDFQRRFNLFGNEQIDKPGWVKWEADVRAEIEKRNKMKKDN